MTFNSYLIAGYGILLFIGGVIGYSTAGSLPSLLMGTLFALLLFGCALLMRKNHSYGYPGALVLAGVLLTFFCYRFLITMHFMPAGMMTIVTILVMSALASRRPSKKA